MEKNDLRKYFDSSAGQRLEWKKRNKHYHDLLIGYFRFFIPEKSAVLEIGCGTGDLLASLNPSRGAGIDFSENLIAIAQERYPLLDFRVMDAECFNLDDTFDYIILSDLVGSLWDVQSAFNCLRKVCNKRTRIIVSYYNYLWEPVMKLGENIRMKSKQPLQNWLSEKDIVSILDLTGFETVKIEKKILLPKYLPFISWLCNNCMANLPMIRHFDLINLIVARPSIEDTDEYSVSIIIPARNERGNIENAILRIPEFGSAQELIFVEGYSQDGTFEEICRIKSKYPSKNIKILKQSGKGKGAAVREGFDAADGDILFILDADLTTPPEDLPKFYDALRTNKGDFVNGCRLVYPMEKQAMRFLNLVANKFFGVLFSYLLGQRLKDTLCGTKVLFKEDYELIKRSRAYFGNFDPFGDFDLLFGAAKLNLKIVEVNVRYKDRQYGTTQISRFKHGWLLIKMAVFASRKLKFY